MKLLKISRDHFCEPDFLLTWYTYLVRKKTRDLIYDMLGYRLLQTSHKINMLTTLKSSHWNYRLNWLPELYRHLGLPNRGQNAAFTFLERQWRLLQRANSRAENGRKSANGARGVVGESKKNERPTFTRRDFWGLITRSGGESRAGRGEGRHYTRVGRLREREGELGSSNYGPFEFIEPGLFLRRPSDSRSTFLRLKVVIAPSVSPLPDCVIKWISFW